MFLNETHRRHNIDRVYAGREGVGANPIVFIARPYGDDFEVRLYSLLPEVEAEMNDQVAEMNDLALACTN